ncbi:hypothetical protein [Martelella mangrovi]|uniref:Lipoprotein n=1 Tax=Martelella mangrovi TaxID=1397477 RepID=A0ABV2IAX5_9HYPH|nr:hypothetical protein [uncultured Martelella sp.]
MKACRVVLSIMFAAFATMGLASCSTTCGEPDVCAQPTPAYQQMSDDDIATMSAKMNGLAGVSNRQ